MKLKLKLATAALALAFASCAEFSVPLPGGTSAHTTLGVYAPSDLTNPQAAWGSFTVFRSTPAITPGK